MYNIFSLEDILSGDETVHVTPTSIISLFHYLFYLLSCNGLVKALDEGGIINLITNTLVQLNQLPVWNEVCFCNVSSLECI